MQQTIDSVTLYISWRNQIKHLFPSYVSRFQAISNRSPQSAFLARICSKNPKHHHFQRDGCSKSCRKHHPSATSQRNARPFQMTMFDWKAAALKLWKHLKWHVVASYMSSVHGWIGELNVTPLLGSEIASFKNGRNAMNYILILFIIIHIILIYTLQVKDYYSKIIAHILGWFKFPT